MMPATPSPRPGRPKTSPLSRQEQLRLPQRAQRARERRHGIVRYPVKLPRSDAQRLKAGMSNSAFVRRLRGFLQEQLIAVQDYDNLATLMWNRRERYITDEEAFRLYERNWRFVDTKRMKPGERAFIARLVEKYGNGVLNV